MIERASAFLHSQVLLRHLSDTSAVEEGGPREGFTVRRPVLSLNDAMNALFRFHLLSEERYARIREECGIQSICAFPVTGWPVSACSYNGHH